MSTDDPQAEVKEFKKAVNMSAKALTAWLNTKESQAVGFKSTDDAESVGHDSGTKIVALLGKSLKEFSIADIAHARKVVGYIHRHLAQRPTGDIGSTPWRYSLMNWGHDPQDPHLSPLHTQSGDTGSRDQVRDVVAAHVPSQSKRPVERGGKNRSGT